MNSKKLTLIVAVILSVFFTSCFKDNDDDVISTREINKFVWGGMNSWYFWQSQVPNLSDDTNDNRNTFNELLNTYNNPRDFFNSLRFQIGITDRFSWFVENYIELQQQFQGISESFGLDFEAVEIDNNTVVIYITYVADNSPAANANIKRGDIINAVNGVAINTDNFNELASRLFSDTVTLSFVSENNGSLDFIEDKTISSAIVTENPVHLRTIFNNVGGKKVGYLVYTGFRSSFNDELNGAFEFFKNEGIDELILDLRLNGGGSVRTASYLASMIYANAGTEVFTDLKHNTKHTDRDGAFNFQNTLETFNANGEKTGEETINRLTTINQLHVLVSNNTASASELVINGLIPFMDVKLFGTTTVGKNVGSITLYDSPASDYQDRNSANQRHLYAMQPIVFQSFNKDGGSDYTQGFEPDIEVKEFEFWNNILPFGDENEAILKAALDDIRGTTKSGSSTKNKANIKVLKTPVFKRFETEMYVENNF